jgi:integrase
MRSPKGTVGVSAHRGMLRLRLPRSVFNGRQVYLCLGLPDTPLNRQAAEMRALAISADIAFDRFDSTLERYRPTATQPDNSPTLGELWDKYTLFKSKTLAHSTLEKDFKWIKTLIQKLPSQRLQDGRQIRRYLLNVLTPKAAKKAWIYFCACCQWAVDDQLISKSPFQDLAKISSGKKSGAINPFSQNERDLIIQGFESNAYYSYYAPFVKFLFLTGCRTSEAIGLQWQHVSPDLSTITFSEAVVYGRRKSTKTNKIRKFPVNQSLRSLLKTIKPLEDPKPDTLVFPSPHGAVIDGHNFLNRAWRTVMGDMPIQYRSVYHTRHTFISLCLEAGIKVGQVARWVGNSPDTIWRHYAGVINQEEVPEL